jgi:putative hydrolase of the HAD superfamily
MRVVCFDLDDTLCKEIDFLKSAYREIASYALQRCAEVKESIRMTDVEAYDTMIEAYYAGKNAFEALNAYLGLNIPMAELLQKYREHIPQISLDDDARYTLNMLKSDGVVLGIISDGRELTQWNKIRALGLLEWISESCIIINSAPECFKPSPSGFERLEAIARELSKDDKISFTYVGDNLNKDFIYPKKRGWKTVCLKDDGRNIHKQNFEITPVEALPDVLCDSLGKILNIEVNR